MSINYSNLQYDPFLEESEPEENKRRKRTKFGRESGQWRFADRTPSPEKETQSINAPATEPTAVVNGEVGVSAGLSPKSLSPVQDQSNEGAGIEEDQSTSSGRFSEKADKTVGFLEPSDDATGAILQDTPEAQEEPVPSLPTSGIGEHIAEHADTLGSRSVGEEVTESQESLQSTTGGFDVDEPMASGLTENRNSPSAPMSATANEALAIDSEESPLAEKVEAAASVVLSPAPEPLESAETPGVLLMQGTSAEPTTSDEDLEDGLSERGMDEESSVGDSDLLISSDGELESSIVSNETASEAEGRELSLAEPYQEMDEQSGVEGSDLSISSDEELESSIVSNETESEADGRELSLTEPFQERVSETVENGHISAADAESPNEPSYFGLDGSVFSRSRSTSNPVTPTEERQESISNQSDAEDETRHNAEGVPLLDTQSESVEADVVKTDATSNNAGDGKISPEAEVANTIKDPIMEYDTGEDEEAETSNDNEITVTSSGRSQRQIFAAEQKPHEDIDTGELEKESFLLDVAQRLVQDNAIDVHVAPFPSSVETNSVGLQGDETEKNPSRPFAVVEGQGEAMDTPSIPPRASNVEIIDLESEDEDEGYPEDVQSENVQSEDPQPKAEVEHILQEPNLMITQDTEEGAPSFGDKYLETNQEAQAKDLPSLQGLNPVDVETVEPQLHIISDKGSPTTNSTSLPRLAQEGNGQNAIDAITDNSNAVNETLHSPDDEFPDILDLFAASRRSVTAIEKTAAIGQLSQGKPPYSQYSDIEVQPEFGTPVKKEMNEEIKETSEEVKEIIDEEKLEILPASDQKLQTQLLTPDPTQQTQLLSEETSLSLKTLHGDQDLPTPSLTQSASATNLSPTTPKRRSFVERLKEIRSLSSKSPRTRRSINAASPWFAPRRSSQIIPNTDSDSVDSEHSTGLVASDDEEHRKDKLSVVPIPQTLRQSPRLHKTLSSTTPSTAPQPTQQPGFRTTLSYFAPLSNLSAHFDTTIDILATVVSSTTPTRAKTGPKDFHQSLYITDPSSASSQPFITTARIFRPHKSAFPDVAQGDAILLRNFKAQSQAKQMMLLSADSSAWAVFRKGEQVQIKGPPVEFAAEERGFVRGLWGWWASLSSDKRETLQAAVPKEKGKPKPKQTDRAWDTATPSPRKTRAAAIRHELRDGTTWVDEPGSEDDANRDKRARSHETSSTPTPRRTRRLVRHELRDGTTYTDGKLGGKYGVHELRDGTRYKEG